MCLSLSNGHARATVLNAVWSPQDQQLVAVVMAATDKTILTALKAELEKNNKHSAVVLAGDAKAELAGAKRGYVHLSGSLDKVHAQGHVMALLHWRAHDPRNQEQKVNAKKNDDDSPNDEYFYVVAQCGETLANLFIERLQLALAWPLQPEWGETLLHLGQEHELIECLPVAHAIQDSNETGHPTFLTALRVLKDEDAWGEVISAALTRHTITF